MHYILSIYSKNCNVTNNKIFLCQLTIYLSRPQVEDGILESQPRQTLVVKTGIYSSTAIRLAISVSVMVSWVFGADHYKQMPRVTVGVAR